MYGIATFFKKSATLEVLHEVAILICIDHLKKLHDDKKTRFKDLLEMEIPSWMVNELLDKCS